MKLAPEKPTHYAIYRGTELSGGEKILGVVTAKRLDEMLAEDKKFNAKALNPREELGYIGLNRREATEVRKVIAIRKRCHKPTTRGDVNYWVLGVD